MRLDLNLNGDSFRAHWFVPALVLILIANAALICLNVFSTTPILEKWLLLNLALVLPILYLICYRRLGIKAVLISLALICLGICGAGEIIPEEEYQILEQLYVLRITGLIIYSLILLRIAMRISEYIYIIPPKENHDHNTSSADTEPPDKPN